MDDDRDRIRSNVPIPDPSLATNERLASARHEIEGRMERHMTQVKEWVDSLQILLESKIRGEVKNLETRLSGNDTALTAAMSAADKKSQMQAENFTAVLVEAKTGIAKQLDSLNEKIDFLRKDTAASGGHAQGISQMVTLIIAAIAAIAAIVAVFISLKTEPEQSIHRYTPTAFYSHAP